MVAAFCLRLLRGGMWENVRSDRFCAGCAVSVYGGVCGDGVDGVALDLRGDAGGVCVWVILFSERRACARWNECAEYAGFAAALRSGCAGDAAAAGWCAGSAERRRGVVSLSAEAAPSADGDALRAALALPLVPWAARNWHTFHVVQPLAPRHVNDPGEPVNLGFYRWMRTWSVDLSNTGQVFWQVGTNPISPADVPARAYDSAAQRERTLELLAEYNLTNSLNPELDAKFAALAAERIRNHPLHYYVVMPLWRVADMWLRPRTEALDMDVFWWNFNDHPAETILAIELGLVNFVYVAGALLAFLQRRVPFAIFCGGYLLLRCALLGTMENSEPRYTLEGFPIVIVCAAVTYAAWFAGRSGARSGPAPRAGS